MPTDYTILENSDFDTVQKEILELIGDIAKAEAVIDLNKRYHRSVLYFQNYKRSGNLKEWEEKAVLNLEKNFEDVFKGLADNLKFKLSCQYADKHKKLLADNKIEECSELLKIEEGKKIEDMFLSSVDILDLKEDIKNRITENSKKPFKPFTEDIIPDDVFSV